jgi:transposase
MDTCTPSPEVLSSRTARAVITRKYRSVEEKRRLVEETLVEGASVALIARTNGVNANQLFGWRKLYLQGKLQAVKKPAMKLLPVRMVDSSPGFSAVAERSSRDSLRSQTSTIEIELRQGQVRIEGSADPVLLRVLLECLR